MVHVLDNHDDSRYQQEDRQDHQNFHDDPPEGHAYYAKSDVDKVGNHLWLRNSGVVASYVRSYRLIGYRLFEQ